MKRIDHVNYLDVQLGDNIKIDVKTGRESVNWVYLVKKYQWQAVMGTVMNFRVA